ncbi:hypothetical protein [Salsipaludibacter albus]|uniref:hypothetical protein n=1 Tax=Salsipaludibacter albus TaxID=2849650 RepID=UPI001EE47431|nr:hypothetical protein [Salsipaludibacter albus]MBY5163452.1 hypothetical protein [Salsipaludibacter albus]
MPGLLAATAKDLRKSRSKSPSLRGQLLRAMGCQPDSHPVAYWEWHELSETLARAHDAIRDVLDTDRHPEAWARDRAGEDIADAVERAASTGDIDAPANSILRPWCADAAFQSATSGSTSGPLFRFRLPYVATGAALTDMAHRSGMLLAEWLELREVEPSTTSFQLLRRLDEDLVDQPTTNPSEIVEAAVAVHQLMARRDAINLTAEWLHEFAKDDATRTVNSVLQLRKLDDGEEPGPHDQDSGPMERGLNRQ